MSHFFNIFLIMVGGFVMAGCASRALHRDAYAGGCVHNDELPPLHLTPENERLLAAVSTAPKTALDYYMLLPKSCFSIMPDSRERRVTYIKTVTLSDDYLNASRWFECNGGGFEVTLKLYRTPIGTFIVLKDDHDEIIFEGETAGEGEPQISIQRPSLWCYSANGWIRQLDESVPKISPRRVLTKYHHDWDADRQYTGPERYIDIKYVLSPETNDIILRGGENFQPGVYEYARLGWRNCRFFFK